MRVWHMYIYTHMVCVHPVGLKKRLHCPTKFNVYIFIYIRIYKCGGLCNISHILGDVTDGTSIVIAKSRPANS
jgi:hypothetical protein